MAVGVGQFAWEGSDERVVTWAVELAEGVAHRNAGDDFDGESVGIDGDGNPASDSAFPVPAIDEFAYGGSHRVVVTPHGCFRERRHQDVVRLAPIRLIVVGGE